MVVWRRARRWAAGQSLVELALVLPVLLLIVLVAIDFGRVFFGYVTLTNATRIGANYAASHPTAWGTPGDAAQQAEYEALILRDTDLANCDLVGGTPPDPTFPNGSTDVGDRVDVGLSCTFRPLTPIVGAIVGSNLVLSANSEFPTRAGSILGVPIAPAATPGPTPVPTPTPGPGATPTPTPTPVPCIVVPDLVNPAPETVAQARSEWSAAGFTGAFSPNGQNTRTVLSQSVPPGTCVAPTTSISVTHT